MKEYINFDSFNKDSDEVVLVTMVTEGAQDE